MALWFFPCSCEKGFHVNSGVAVFACLIVVGDYTSVKFSLHVVFDQFEKIPNNTMVNFTNSN